MAGPDCYLLFGGEWHVGGPAPRDLIGVYASAEAAEAAFEARPDPSDPETDESYADVCDYAQVVAILVAEQEKIVLSTWSREDGWQPGDEPWDMHSRE